MLRGGTGWKPDSHEVAAKAERFNRRHPSLYGARDLPVRTSGKLSKLVDVRDQVDSEGCVGFSMTGACLVRLRSLGFNPPRFSPLAVWALARMLMRTDKQTPLYNEGCFPYFGAFALKEFGIPLESDFPFRMSDYEREPDLDVFQKASQFRVTHFLRVNETGEDRVEAVMRALAHERPICLGMSVGRQFSTYRKGLGPVAPDPGNEPGRHMAFLTDYEDAGDTFVGCNSWGKEYGDEGLFRISRDKLKASSTTDLYEVVVTEQKAAR